MKKFSTLAITPLYKSVNFYRVLYTWHVSLTDKVIYLGIYSAYCVYLYILCNWPLPPYYKIVSRPMETLSECLKSVSVTSHLFCGA